MTTDTPREDPERRLETLKLADLDFSIVEKFRTGVDQEAVEAYARDWKQLPALKARWDGEKYWVTDGLHRNHAAALAKKKSAPVQVADGTYEDAEIDALGENSKHGVRHTHEEKRLKVEYMLDHPTMCKKSARWMAETAKVDPKTVRAVKKEREPATVPGEDQSPPDPEAERVQGKDGKSYPARQPVPKKKGKRGAAKMGFGEPEARGAQPDAEGFGAAPDDEKWLCGTCDTWWPGSVKKCQTPDCGNEAEVEPADPEQGATSGELYGEAEAGDTAEDVAEAINGALDEAGAPEAAASDSGATLLFAGNVLEHAGLRIERLDGLRVMVQSQEGLGEPAADSWPAVILAFEDGALTVREVD